MTVVRVGAREDGTGGELVAAVETNGSVDVLTGVGDTSDADRRLGRPTTISAVPKKQNLDWGAGSMQHELESMSLQQPQPQRRPPAGGRVVPVGLRGAAAEHRMSGVPPDPPPVYGRKRVGP